MSSFPNRCQHLKVNGTQCGSPALRRNKFCYFHNRHHEERLEITLDRLRQNQLNIARIEAGLGPIGPATLELPVLEDTDSIQVSLMQIMRFLVVGHIDHKTAGLLLYALQTASSNLGRTRFEPRVHDVVLNPRDVGDSVIGEHIWADSDFEGEEDEDEEDSDEEEDDDDETEEDETEDDEEEDAQDEDDDEAEPTAPVGEAKPTAKVDAKPKTAPAPAKSPPAPPKLPPSTAQVARQIRDQVRAALPEIIADHAARKNQQGGT